MSARACESFNIDWLSDHQLQCLRNLPEQCRALFGQPGLLDELIECMRQTPADARWYRPAGVWVNGQCVAAGGFKGAPIKGCVEIGYRVVPEHRRKGYASALVRWLCAQAQQEPVRWILALTEPGNLASRTVLSHNGFVHTGDLLSDRQHWLKRWQYRLI